MGKSLVLSSKKAIIHEKTITPMSGQLLLTPVCDNFKCPYQASVMNTLLSMSKIMVYSPFIASEGIHPCFVQHDDHHP